MEHGCQEGLPGRQSLQKQRSGRATKMRVMAGLRMPLRCAAERQPGLGKLATISIAVMPLSGVRRASRRREGPSRHASPRLAPATTPKGVTMSPLTTALAQRHGR